ncbi:unnamed protein product [Blepharisma stoltei]|uniref:Ubiquitin-activating enzyme E1 C-terminal domain-containing protein n=1 Tax=Blepharisma stoltei TaxID=1481888 RepID=A0AAU9IKJ7_9CILI|nr:unnamed protein product [Blepharisma stoltei]
MRDCFMNLAISYFSFLEPQPAIMIKSVDYDETLAAPKKAYNDGFTKWDEIVVDGPCTIEELIENLKEKYKILAIQIGCGTKCLFNKYMAGNKDEIFKKEVYELYREISEDKTDGKTSVCLILYAVSAEDRTHMKLPPLKYIFSH